MKPTQFILVLGLVIGCDLPTDLGDSIDPGSTTDDAVDADRDSSSKPDGTGGEDSLPDDSDATAGSPGESSANDTSNPDPDSEGAKDPLSGTGTDTDPEEVTSIDDIPQCDDVAPGPVTVAVAFVANATLPAAMVIGDPASSACLWSVNEEVISVRGGNQVEQAPAGEFQIAIRAEVGNASPPDLGEIVATSQVHTLVEGQDYILLFSDGLAEESLVALPTSVPTGQFGIRYVNLESAPISIFAWDRTDLDAAPIPLLTNLLPGAVTELFLFDFAPEQDPLFGFSSAFVTSTRDDAHPLDRVFPNIGDGGSTRCPTAVGATETVFVAPGADRIAHCE